MKAASWRLGVGALLIAAVCLVAAVAEAASKLLIRDTEIEETLRRYGAPVFAAAGLTPESVRIVLLQDRQPNAFVSGGQIIFLYTGALLKADDPDQVIGVLAHEVGHIAGGHLARGQEAVQDAQARALLTMLAGVPLALATGRGEALGAVVALGGQIGTRSFLQYSRGMESAADQAAVTFLRRADLSMQGLLAFLAARERQEALYRSTIDPYVLTHPVTRERLDFFRYQLERNGDTGPRAAPALVLAHQRMRAKLRGFLLPPEQTARLYPATDRTPPAHLARAISLMRQSLTAEALTEAEALLAAEPSDPFAHELKGDILFNAGRMGEAAAAYQEALAFLPDAPLIHQAAARALLEQGAEAELARRAAAHLRQALRREPETPFSWRLLAIAEGRSGNAGLADLALAEEAMLMGRDSDARMRAARAQRALPAGSAAALRASDILAGSKVSARVSEER